MTPLSRTCQRSDRNGWRCTIGRRTGNTGRRRSSCAGIHKSFGSVHAKRGVSLAIAKGSITGIVGENGAGKSTLMSILYGLYRADAGEILHRRPAGARSDNPHDAIAAGIGMVHQHFMLVDTFTVLENLVLGAEGGPLLAAGLAAARAELERLAREYGLTVDPDAQIADLPVGEQQRVEILKVLFRGAAHPDPRRADRRADAAGDRPAVPHPARR